MAEITAQMVMDLRQKTGAKMMDAKRALVEADGDFTAAMELLREKGQADAAKRSGRATALGIVVAAQDANHAKGALAEVNCETDFVANTDHFKALAHSLATWALQHGSTSAGHDLSGDDLPPAQVEEIHETISKTGENIQFRRGVVFSSADGVVESYIHLGGKIGVLVQVDGARGEDVRLLAKDLAMQVAAASPEFLSRDEVPEAVQEREMEIYRTLARNEGKPEAILDKIAAGKLDKYFKDFCLMEQPFIKDPDKNVKALVADVCKTTGTTLKVSRIVRYQLGQ